MNENHENPPQNQPAPQSKWRPAIVIMRWTLAAAWTASVLFSPPDSGAVVGETGGFLTGPALALFFSYGVMCFLFANALWQHMPLKKALVVAALFALSAGVASALFQLLSLGSAVDPLLWVIEAAGVAAGAAIAYPLLQVIDRLITYGQN